MSQIDEKKSLLEDGEEILINSDLKISPGTIARTIVLALALVNQFLAFFGKPLIKFSSAEITELVANFWTLAAAIAAWWKNNSFTLPARAGDVIMNLLRRGKISVDGQDAEGEDDGAQ